MKRVPQHKKSYGGHEPLRDLFQLPGSLRRRRHAAGPAKGTNNAGGQKAPTSAKNLPEEGEAATVSFEEDFPF